MITHDIQRFSTHLAAIYSNLAKPILDVILYNYQLSQNVGAEGLAGLTILVNGTAMLRELPCSVCVCSFADQLLKSEPSLLRLAPILLFLLSLLDLSAIHMLVSLSSVKK